MLLYHGGNQPLNLEEARKYFGLAAAQAHRDAQCAYARMLQSGRGGPQDLVQAREFYRLSANQGFAEAQCSYAEMLIDGQGGGCDLENARKYFKSAADQDILEAQYRYAVMMKGGQGGGPHPKIARDYFQRVADRGHAGAQYALANLLREGIHRVIAIDLPRSNEYLRRAAEQNLVEAQFEYALLLYGGENGLPRDLNGAREYFRRAAQQEHPEARLKYAKMLRNEEGADVFMVRSNRKRDLIRARRIYALEANRGSAEAQHVYAEMLRDGQGGGQNLIEAREHFRRAADQDNAESQYAYAEMLRDGQGGAQDLIDARNRFGSLAQQGHAKGCFSYGCMLYQGLGGNQDFAQARENFRLAAGSLPVVGTGIAHSARATDPIALYYYGAMLYSGQGGEKDIRRARDYFQYAANNNVVEAQYVYGFILLHHEVPKKLNDAREYYELAARAGFRDAQREYALMLRDGEGGPADLDQARIFFRLAAEQGDEGARRDLDAMPKGGSPLHVKRAYEYFRRAAEQGHLIAQYSYADILRGIGGREDLVQARAYYSRVIEQIEQQKGVDILQWDENAVRVLYVYATMLRNGEGGPQNLVQAREIYHRVSKRNQLPPLPVLDVPVQGGLASLAQYVYAEMLQKGQGGPQDLGQAQKFYRRAADQGHAGAKCDAMMTTERPTAPLPAPEWWSKIRVDTQAHDEAKRAFERYSDFTVWRDTAERFKTPEFMVEYSTRGKVPVLNDGKAELGEWLSDTLNTNVFKRAWSTCEKQDFARPFIIDMVQAYSTYSPDSGTVMQDAIKSLNTMLGILADDQEQA